MFVCIKINKGKRKEERGREGEISEGKEKIDSYFILIDKSRGKRKIIFLFN